MNENERLEKNEKIKLHGNETREKRKSQVCKVFKVKIDESKLNKVQKEQLKMLFVEGKWIWNSALSWSENPENKLWEYKQGKTVIVKNKDGNFETRELKFLGSQLVQSVTSQCVFVVRSLSAAKKQNRKVGKLKYKSNCSSIDLPQFGGTHKIKSSKRIKIQKVQGTLYVNGMHQFLNIPNIEFANAKILNTPNGYYVAFTTYQNKEEETRNFKPVIGIDLGCSTTLTTSEEKKFDVRIEEPVRLKRLQRKFAKQTENFTRRTNNSRKTLRLIKREYQKISNQKTDLANKIVAELLEHEKVFMQDENLRAWKAGGHGKAVQHSVLGRIKLKLKDRPRVVVLDRFVPTTKSCECGFKHEKLELSDRLFVCPNCGLTEDRDVHAAKNMIRFGKLEILKNVGQELIEFTPVDTKALAETALEVV